MKSWKKPTPELLAKAEAKLTHAQFYRRFFEGLQNPEWIVPLRDRKWFDNPPLAERDIEHGTIGFRTWAASEYLVRMSEYAPEIVAETIQRIPENDNASVHGDFLEAAMRLPFKSAAEIARKEAKWIATQPILYMLLPEKLGRLAVRLAKGGEHAAALKLLQALLSIEFKPRSEEEYKYQERALSRVDAWHYRDFLGKFFPELAPALGLSLIDYCAVLLNAYMCETYKGQEETGKDHSYIWRPAIESHSQNTEGRLEDALVVGCRDSGELAINAGVTTLNEVLSVFKRSKWLLFRRLELHLVRKCGSKEQVNAYVAQKDLFEALCVRHEYVALLRERVGDLADETVRILGGWIKTGPDVEKWGHYLEGSSDKRLTAEERTKFEERWKRERLAMFGSQIPATLASQFGEILARYAAPEHPEFPAYISSGWVGEESPKSADELKALSDDALVEYLKTWVPPRDGRHDETRSGLGQVLAKVVKTEPRRYALLAARFADLDPTYSRWLLNALEEAVKGDAGIPLDGVLGLCEWIAGSHDPLPAPRGIDEDPDWRWVRKAAVSFLKVAFEKDAVALGARAQAWRVIVAVACDPDPAPADESEISGANVSEPETVSLNTSRGQAMHTAMQYALWLRRCFDREGAEGKVRVARGFVEMPEVKALLEDHLDPAKDPSPAIRSIYGQWFPWLFLLDPGWAGGAAPRIFPTAREADLLSKTAWKTYLSFCRPYDNVFRALEIHYSAAIERLGEDIGVKSRDRNPDERLGDHLVTFYWRGLLGLDDGSIFHRYLVNATDELRASVIEHVGRSLCNTKGEVPKEYLDRIMGLWDWLTNATPVAGKIGPKTSAAFGWWFISEKFPIGWILPRLVMAVQFGKNIKPTQHLVAEKLTKLAASYDLEPVLVYDVLARNDKEGWNVSNWEEDARGALERALRSDRPEPKKIAAELINFLGKRGYLRFGELLAPTKDE